MELLEKLLAGIHLSQQEAEAAMEGMVGGSFTPAQSAALLVALKMKGETAEEILAFARVMRKRAVKITPHAQGLLDTCGTGGDGSHTFNVSTAAALIAAGAGAAVAKHGNRSVSSKCGSADVIEALGMKILQPQEAEKCIGETGFGFLFAPYFHPAMKNVAQVRRELGVRTIFNVLGPLSNPAGAQSQLIGVFSEEAARKMADALCMLGTTHAIVASAGGLDEISLGKSAIFEVKGGRVERLGIDAADFGFAQGEIPKVQSAQESAGFIMGILEGKQGAARDVAVLNAGTALYAAGKAGSIACGVGLAKGAIDSGKAREKFEQVKLFCEKAGGG
jgi:anthranilate phosphoribosyltransferase